MSLLLPFFGIFVAVILGGFSLLCLFVRPQIAAIIMVAAALFYYISHHTVPREETVGVRPIVNTGVYSQKVETGMISVGNPHFTDYDEINLSMANNSAAALVSVDLICHADEISYGQRTNTSFHAYWAGTLPSGTSITTKAIIPYTHADPDKIIKTTLNCKVNSADIDHIQAMVAMGSDSAQTQVDARFIAKHLYRQYETLTSRHQIVIDGDLDNRSSLPVLGAEFDCYLGGRKIGHMSAKLPQPAAPGARRAFHGEKVVSPAAEAESHFEDTSCVIARYDFGEVNAYITK